MEKENKFKLKLSNFFSSSCKTQNLSDVIDHNKTPIFTSGNTIFLKNPLIEELDDENENYPFQNNVIKHKTTPSSSLLSSLSLSSSTTSSGTSLMRCKPRCPETFDQMVRENCIISAAGNTLCRRKITGKYSFLSPAGDISGRMCPPASPASPLFQKQGKNNNNSKKKKKKREKMRKQKTTHFMKKGFNQNPFSFSSSNETENGDWFSSDDEREDDEKQAVFSLKSVSFSSKSISFSSDSDDNNPVQTRAQTQTQSRPRPRLRRRKPGLRPKEVGVVPLEGKVKDTFAVVKSSSDPYNDFRTSMVEMIIEKQIFGAKELEQLLQCFLSLNSTHHHRVIVEVFTEIWDALFSHFS